MSVITTYIEGKNSDDELYGKWQLPETPPQNGDKVQFIVLIPTLDEYNPFDGHFDGKLFWWKTPFDERFFRPNDVVVWRKILY